VSTPSETAAFLAEVRVFQDVALAHRVGLAERLRDRALRKGQILFRQGEQGEEMFLVRHGTIVVSKAVTGNVEQVLARFGPGDFFGEMALFDRSPRSATISAETDATLLVLDRDNLRRLTETNPQAAAAFFHALVLVFIERLRASGELVAEVTRWGLEATGLDVDSR
jgi:CRP-like cAMP-binding protein